MPAPSGFAFFDLDHTLLPHDTQALFCNYVLRRETLRVFLHLVFLPFALLKACRVASTLRAKRAFMGYLWRMPAARLRQYAREFAERSVKSWAYPELLAELERHRQEGRALVLNTASPDFYAREISRVLGFDHCVATKAQLTDPLSLHPRIKVNNKEEAKIEAMLQQVPGVADLSESDRNEHCWAYSDSAADLPLLRFGGTAVLVHPSAHLATLGIRYEWSFLYPKRPYRTKFGDMLAVARQVLGFYPEVNPGAATAGGA